MCYSYTSFGHADIPSKGHATLRGGRNDRDVPVVLIGDEALLETHSLPETAASFDFVKSAFHQIRVSLIQSYLEK